MKRFTTPSQNPVAECSKINSFRPITQMKKLRPGEETYSKGSRGEKRVPADVNMTAIHNTVPCVLLSSFRIPTPLPHTHSFSIFFQLGSATKDRSGRSLGILVSLRSKVVTSRCGRRNVPECANMIQLARAIVLAQVPEGGKKAKKLG